MNLRVLQWNISTRSKKQRIGSFLSRLIAGPTVIALQEVTRSACQALCSMLRPRSAAFSLDLREPGRHEGKNRGMGVAVLSFGLDIASWELVSRSVFPERTLFVTLGGPDGTIGLLNFHALTGVGYRQAKASNFASLADFFEERSAELDFACFDANEPKVDAMSENDLVFWDNGDGGDCASLILGKNRVHPLRDSYRRYLEKQGTTVSIDPLAVSHLTRGRARRYDYITCSPAWEPVSVAYPFEESIAATSDHSIVVGDFRSNAEIV